MIAILGGGITGLSAAYQLKKKGIDFVLLEQEQSVGGKIKSLQHEGYTCELGPNTVLVNNQEIKTLLEDLNLSQKIISPNPNAVKNRFILKNGKIEAIPKSLGTALKSNLVGLNTLLHVVKEPFIKKNNSNQDESLASFIKRRMGQQVYEDLITPFVTGIYAGDPEKMSINYVLNVLKEAEVNHGSVLKGMIKTMKRKKQENEAMGLPKEKIFSFENGLQELIKSLEFEVKQYLQLNCKIEKISRKGDQYMVSYQKDQQLNQLNVDQIISTIPAHPLVEAFPSASFSKHISKIYSVPAVVLHFGYSKKQIGFQEPAFGLLSRANEEVPFLGILFNSRFFPHTSSSENELITVICGGYRYPDLIDKEDDIIVEEVLNSIEPLLRIEGKPNFTNIKKWKKGIPQYELGYAHIEKSIIDFEKENPNFRVGGNFYKGVSVSDCVKNGINLANHFS